MDDDAKYSQQESEGRNTPPKKIVYEEERLIWKAPEYIYHEKTADWYWILGIGIITVMVVALLLNNLLFAIFALIAGFTIALFSARKPEVFEYQINEKGVQIENKLYPYPTLNFFWVDDTTSDAILILESQKPTVPQIIIPVENINSGELRDFLRDYLPEEYIERPWSQLLMERLGF